MYTGHYWFCLTTGWLQKGNQCCAGESIRKNRQRDGKQQSASDAQHMIRKKLLTLGQNSQYHRWKKWALISHSYYTQNSLLDLELTPDSCSMEKTVNFRSKSNSMIRAMKTDGKMICCLYVLGDSKRYGKAFHIIRATLSLRQGNKHQII